MLVEILFTLQLLLMLTVFCIKRVIWGIFTR